MPRRGGMRWIGTRAKVLRLSAVAATPGCRTRASFAAPLSTSFAAPVVFRECFRERLDYGMHHRYEGPFVGGGAVEPCLPSLCALRQTPHRGPRPRVTGQGGVRFLSSKIKDFTVPELKKMTVPELKKMLEDRGVSTAGLKADLVDRLKAATESSGGESSNGGDAEAMQYQKKTPVEHILHRPDVYIGSMEATECEMFVYDMESKKVEFRSVNYVPGLLKLFDEILVNAADNKIRDPSMDRIEVTIKENTNTVSIWNNGKGIPVIKHAQYEEMYVPELIMGNLLAGSNFDDTQKRLGGGRHGYGAKLTNIFSTAFTVETADSVRKLLYKQTWRNNMSVCEPAEISPMGPGSTDYTRVTFT